MRVHSGCIGVSGRIPVRRVVPLCVRPGNDGDRGGLPPNTPVLGEGGLLGGYWNFRKIRALVYDGNGTYVRQWGRGRTEGDAEGFEGRPSVCPSDGSMTTPPFPTSPTSPFLTHTLQVKMCVCEVRCVCKSRSLLVSPSKSFCLYVFLFPFVSVGGGVCLSLVTGMSCLSG